MAAYAPAQIIAAPAQLVTAPAQPPAIGAVVYTALLRLVYVYGKKRRFYFAFC